ncbi:MAG: trehalase family glycosidase [Methanosarcinales archaeon]
MFNSILCQANRDLIQIANIIGEESEEIEAWLKKTLNAINVQCWNEENNIYYDYDVFNKKYLKTETASCFLPLFANIPSKNRAEKLYQHLNSSCFCKIEEECFALPNYDRCREDFSATNYWRGPVWININWMIRQGMLRYNFKYMAKK